MKAVAGQGVEGTVGWRRVGMWAGGNSGGFGVFVPCMKQTPNQNHMCFLTDKRLRREYDQETSVHSLLCLQTMPKLPSHQGTDEKHHPVIP